MPWARAASLLCGDASKCIRVIVSAFPIVTIPCGAVTRGDLLSPFPQAICLQTVTSFKLEGGLS